MSKLRFSLSTLFIAVTISAIGVFLWVRFVAPNVTGVSMSGGDIVLHVGDEVVRKMLPDNEYLKSLAENPDVHFHDAYVKIPIHVVAISLILAFGFVGAVRLTWPKIAKRIWRPKNSD